jgi:membrane fusion protein (multidrug efflux system)
MKYFTTAILFFFFTVIACKNNKDKVQNKQQPPPVVDVIIASYQSVANTIEVNGTIVPDEFAELHPEISGVLTFLNVNEGNYVPKGTIIARVNNSDLVPQLNKLKVQLDLAKTTEQRYRKLLDISGINRADYDVALNQVNSLQADINSQQALIGKSIVRAPFSGIIGLKQLSPGAYVNSTTILATMQ